MNFDLAKMEQDRGATFRVVVGRTPDGAEAGFVVVGPNSAEYEQADRKIQVMNIMEAGQRRRMVDAADPKDAEAIAEGAQKRKLLLVESCVVGWFGITDNGQDVPYSVEALRRLLKVRPTFVSRVIEAIENEANFSAG